jgi:hypothetical protein
MRRHGDAAIRRGRRNENLFLPRPARRSLPEFRTTGQSREFQTTGEVGSTKRLVPWAILLCRFVPIVRSPIWRSFLGERPDQTSAFGQGIRQPSHHGELSGALAG